MKYTNIIDPHVHLRGKEYIEDYRADALRIAKSVGIAAMIEMPNCVPNLITPSRIRERRQGGVRCHVGITNNAGQVKEILAYAQQHGLGDKIYYCHSTGDMGTLDPDYQRWIWKTKVEMGYKGVSLGHFEDPDLFADSQVHYIKQNPTAETVSVLDQLRNAFDFGFEGTFYICHVSNPATIDLVERERSRVPFRIIIEMTWHHMLLNTDHPHIFTWCKCNPPLRDPVLQSQLIGHVLGGRVDIIATDHAPHLVADKRQGLKSGIAALHFWPYGIAFLRKLKVSEEWIKAMTYGTANRVFDLKIPDREFEFYETDFNDTLYGVDCFAEYRA